MIINCISKTAFGFILSSPQKVQASFFSETMVCPTAIIDPDFTAHYTTVFRTADTFAQIFTVLAYLSFGSIFHYSIISSESETEEFLASRTNKTVVFRVIAEVISGKVLAGYISKSSLRNTTLYLIVMKIFEIVFIAITTVCDSRRRFNIRVRDVFFKNLFENLIISDICCCRNSCGDNTVLVIDGSVVLIAENRG